MKLNTLSPTPGSKSAPKRLGRGIGSGLGKTSGKGHKGQKARSGGYHKIQFEGGQMPIQRRLPKFGFTSRVGKYTDEVALSGIDKLNCEFVDLNTLKKHGLINQSIREVKVILSGEITRAVKLKGLRVTKGARLAIEEKGGTIEE